MLRVVTLLLVMILLLAACAPGEEATTEEPIDAQAMLMDVVIELRELETFRLLLVQEGAIYNFYVKLDDSGENTVRASLRRGEAQFLAPDIFYATVNLRVEGLPLSMILYAEGDDQWFRLPSSPWFHSAFAEDFDASALIRENSGFQQALVELKSLEYIGPENLDDGTETYHIRGVAGGANITDLLFGLLETEDDVVVDVYVGKESGLPELLFVTQPETATEDTDPTRWRIEMYDINAEPEIEYPDDVEPKS